MPQPALLRPAKAQRSSIRREPWEMLTIIEQRLPPANCELSTNKKGAYERLMPEKTNPGGHSRNLI